MLRRDAESVSFQRHAMTLCGKFRTQHRRLQNGVEGERKRERSRLSWLRWLGGSVESCLQEEKNFFLSPTPTPPRPPRMHGGRGGGREGRKSFVGKGVPSGFNEIAHGHPLLRHENAVTDLPFPPPPFPLSPPFSHERGTPFRMSEKSLPFQ